MTENGTVKLSLVMSEEAKAKLKEIATKAGTTTGDVLRLGLGLYDIAAEAKAKGLKLYLLDQDHKFVTEIDGI